MATGSGTLPTWHLAPFPAFADAETQTLLTQHFATAAGAAHAMHLHSLIVTKIAAERGEEVRSFRTLTPCEDPACEGCATAVACAEEGRKVFANHARRWGA